MIYNICIYNSRISSINFESIILKLQLSIIRNNLCFTNKEYVFYNVTNVLF